MFELILRFTEVRTFNANSVDPDQTPRSVASDPELHCQCPFYGTPGINGLIFQPCRPKTVFSVLQKCRT